MGKKPRALAYLYEATAKSRFSLLLLTVLEVTVSLLNIAFVLTMRRAMDGAAEQDGRVLRLGILCLAGIIVLRISARGIIRFLDERVRASIENNLKGRLIHHLLHSDYAKTESVHTGEWMNRLTSDTAVVAGGLAEILPSFCGMAVKLTGAAAAIVLLIPDIVYFLLPVGVFTVFITWILRRRMKKLHKEVQASDGFLRMFLQERLSSMMIIRAFRGEDAVERESARRMKNHKQARMRRNTVSNICNIGFSGLMNAMYLVGFGYCGYGIAAGAITYGTLLAVIQLIGQIQTPFAGLSGVIPRFYSMVASAERLLEAELLPKEESAGPSEVGDFSELAVEHVSFSYPDGDRQEVLSDISLNLRKGDYVALTGPSGCGKSTLFKLLLCLYSPGGGKLMLRTANGDAEPLGVSHRSYFSYVPQGNLLMSGTVREVVTMYGDGDVERVRDALKVACAESFVDALENGLDTPLGEYGAGLSEGQMQRLAIARAVYSDAPIILFDEATSSLDSETERQVLQNLRAMTDKTVLTVTHRPAALSICNRVLELSRGELRELPRNV